MRAGIRGFEFDTLADPKAGAYAYSAALKLTGASNTLISPDMLKPGIKVSPSVCELLHLNVVWKHPSTPCGFDPRWRHNAGRPCSLNLCMPIINDLESWQHDSLCRLSSCLAAPAIMGPAAFSSQSACPMQPAVMGLKGSAVMCLMPGS